MAIVRARHTGVYPARFALVAATNPCPCGYLGEAERCRCSAADIARHRRKLSGPLLDRMDLIAHLERPDSRALSMGPASSSAQVGARVVDARARQNTRLRETGIGVNAHMDVRLLRRHLVLSEDGEQLTRRIQERSQLSTRGLHRVLRVARTAADLEGSGRTCARHLSIAMSLRTRADAVYGRVA